MAPKLVPILVLVLFALALCPACTAPTTGGWQPGGTQAPAGGQPGTPPQTGGQLYPGPTVTIPPGFNVEVQENRNRNPIHPDITVTFRGGEGQIFLQKIVATVIRSDGQVITKELVRPDNGQISVGDSMVFQGTTGVDRVVVVVTLTRWGDLKIMDMLDDYYSHP